MIRSTAKCCQYYEEIVTVTMAENGRLNIPDDMLQYAGITKGGIYRTGHANEALGTFQHLASRLSVKIIPGCTKSFLVDQWIFLTT